MSLDRSAAGRGGLSLPHPPLEETLAQSTFDAVAVPVGATLVVAHPRDDAADQMAAERKGSHKGCPYRRPARNLHFPSPPAERGEMPQAEGGSGRGLTR